jgi:hypothetical protein
MAVTATNSKESLGGGVARAPRKSSSFGSWICTYVLQHIDGGKQVVC